MRLKSSKLLSVDVFGFGYQYEGSEEGVLRSPRKRLEVPRQRGLVRNCVRSSLCELK